MKRPADRKTDKRIFLAALFVAALAVGAVADQLKITGVDFEKHKLYDRYIIGTSAYIVPKSRMMDERLVIDFKGAEVEKPLKLEVNGSPRVASVRTGQFSSDPLIGRVVFDLKRDIHYEIASMIGEGKVVVEISNNEQGRASFPARADPAATKEAKMTETRPATAEVKLSKLKTVVAKALTHKATLEAVTHKQKPKPEKKLAAVKPGRKYPLKGKIIVVDPGHGGTDPGATGLGGVQEKTVTLKTSFFLRDQLRELGARVYMTRTTDVKNTLQEIADFTNRMDADAYIGVHFNAIDNPKISGTETHYYTAQSLGLAEAVHRRLLRGIRRDDRGVMQTMLFTIHHARMPAIIVEPVYMTHFQDGLLIKSKSFQTEVARDIALGIEDFFHGR
ncbi:MAG TPA: N-acetylmuramoyl-L-alanine amidase [Candidatus Omnitrophota bacterium]|nr:N-acetylmuramoyl-L-alanine amidase [Candidatus Omnitrophota bacterium]